MVSLFLGFLGSILLLGFSARKFLGVLSVFWKSIKISPLIIGTTLVAVGTSLPELVVAVFAVIRGDIHLTVGNLLGADVILVFLVLAVGILFGRVNIGIKKTQKNAVFLAVITFLVLIFPPFYFSSLKIGLLFLCLIFLFFMMEIYWGIGGRTQEDRKYIGNGKVTFKPKILGEVVLFLVGVIFGGFLTVHFAEKIVEFSGYSSSVIGMSLLALATTLPELMTTVLAINEDQKKMVVGNILGSCIFNLLFLGVIVGLLAKEVVMVAKESLYFLGCANLILVLIVFFYGGKRVPKKLGLFLILFLGFYLNWLF